MSSTTRKLTQAAKSAAKNIFIALAVLAGLIFLCVYFNPSSSSDMVNGDISLILGVLAACIFVVTGILWIKTRRRHFFIFVSASLFVFFGTFFIPSIFENTAPAFMLYGLAVCAVTAVYYCVSRRMNTRKAALLIIAAGCVMRIGFGMAVPTTLNLHDYVFGSDFETSSGHAQYIGYIAENLSLPESYSGQYYHPPLHHIIGAIFYWFCNSLGFIFTRFAESLQFVTSAYSALALVTWYKILDHLDLDKGALLIPLAIIAFHPNGWLMGACLNNDMLMWLLVTVCLLYLIKWYKNPTTKNIAMMALTLGLGMMTKLSAVFIAPIILIIFIYRLINKGNGCGYAPIIRQYSVFACLSIPLGMWYPVRNLIKFGQSFGHVPLLPKTYSQYIGVIPFIQRLFGISSGMFQSPYVLWEGVDYNFFIKVQKTALFDEASWLTETDSYAMLAGLLSIVNYAVVLVSLASIAYVLMKMPRNNKYVIFVAIAVYYLILTASHINFSYLFPFQCTNDIRYVAINIGIGALFIAQMLRIVDIRRHKEVIKKSHTPKMLPLTLLFCFLSCLIFFLDSLYRVF